MPEIEESPNRKQGDQTPQPKAPSPTVAAVENAPEPSSKGGKVIRTGFPHGSFVIEGLPVITREGVRVTAEQFEKVQEAAAKQKPPVRIVEVND
jgi:hypothetical protein